ncbi:MAG TPA: glycerophosphodiester phosphodiesterase family protein [Lysobacter sp.]|nr:glycerophosphodiester phosphodiesterase family protein [Lysobacter sp.]
MIVIAHRGARAFAPENTLEAFDKAFVIGADAVELDVQLAADGMPFVWHDSDLRRCSDVEARFPHRAPWNSWHFTLDELRQLDAGSWFARELSLPPKARQPFLRTLSDDERSAWCDERDARNYASGTIRVPTLVEALDCCRQHGLQVHVELKSIPRLWPELAERVLSDIDRLAMRGAVVVSSFDHRQLARMRALAPDIELAVLSSDRLHRPAAYLAMLGAGTYIVGCHGDDDTLGFQSPSGELDSDMIDALRDAGYGVAAWTENDPVRMRTLVDAGVSGIFTDYPNRLLEVLGRAARGR